MLDNLVCSDIDSEQGLRLTVEKAINSSPMLNLERPAFIRQCFEKKMRVQKSVMYMELRRLLGLYLLVLIHEILLYVKCHSI